MFLKSKFLGVALATCVAVPVLAFASGGVPDCASAEVRKALDNNHRIKQVIETGFSIKLSDFKTLSKDIKQSHIGVRLFNEYENGRRRAEKTR